MKKYIIFMLMFLCSIGVAWAQDEEESDEGSEGSVEKYAPAAGDFSGAVLFGRGIYVTNGLVLPSSITINQFSGNVTTISGASPNASNVVGDENFASNMIGGEARYFITNRIAVKLGGSAIIRNTPDRANIPAPVNQNNTASAALIPNYQAVTAQNDVDLAINVGGEYHFESKYDRLFPYVGLNLPFFHGRRSAYDPTITLESDGSATITDISTRHVELFGFGAEGAAGIDYYLMEGFFFGFEIKPVSYIYLYTKKYPAAGLEELGADTHTLSFFSRPVFKIGFRF
jgi:outer membrane protein W